MTIDQTGNADLGTFLAMPFCAKWGQGSMTGELRIAVMILHATDPLRHTFCGIPFTLQDFPAVNAPKSKSKPSSPCRKMAVRALDHLAV